MRFAIILFALFFSVSVGAQPIITGAYRNLEPPRAYWELGINSCNYIMSTNGTSYQSLATPVWPPELFRMGLNFDYSINNKLYFQFGLHWVYNGCDSQIDPKFVTPAVRTSTFEIPIILQYKAGRVGGLRPFVGAGGFLAFNLNGNIRKNGDYGPTNIGSDATFDMKNFGAGAQAVAGVWMNKYNMLKFTYEIELLNLSPNDAMKGKMSYNGMSITYFHRKKPKNKHHKPRGIFYPKI